MEKVQIYLKTAIFTRKAQEGTRRITPIRTIESTVTLDKVTDPIPPKAVILDGSVEQTLPNGFVVIAQKYYSVKHEELEGEETKLFLPTSKIDHIRIQD